MKTVISGTFQRSKRLDSDSVDEGYVLLGTARQALDTMAENLLHSKQRAFTWTGPYGCGKSSLALFLASLVGSDDERKKVAHLIPEGSNVRTAFCAKKGWKVIRVVGRQGAIREDIGSAIGVISDTKLVLDGLRQLAFKEKSPDGLMIIVDEAGKYLEADCASDNAYFLQELAEMACRAETKIVVVAIFHQAMDVYASRMPFALRDEWSKVQGRFIDIPLVGTTDESLELLSRAITHPSDWVAPSFFNEVVTLAVRATVKGGTSDASLLTRQLTCCWPLNPVTALLLGPVSRKKFSQNERSIYSFLNALEPFGFMEFLQNSKPSDLYSPAHYWDYLKSNLEVAIMTSGDGHRWMTACDAISRAESIGATDLLILAKTVAIIDLFRNGSRLQASEELLAASMCTDIRTVRLMLQKLVKARVLVERRHMNAWAIYAGSDFDLEAAMKEALAQQSGIDVSLVSRLVKREPVVAREHYLTTGTLRWFDCRITTSSGLSFIENEKVGDTGSVGEFVLVIPEETCEIDQPLSREQLLRQWGKKYRLDDFAVTKGQCLVLGIPENAQIIRNFLLDLQAINAVSRDPALEGDDTGRGEVRLRESFVRQRLNEELDDAFFGATWFAFNRCQLVTNQQSLIHYASALCSDIFFQAPRIVNELINRDHLSTNISKARRELLYAMLEKEGTEKLNFEGFSPAYALYLSMLSTIHNCKKGKWAFITKPKDTTGSYAHLWNATEKLLKSKSIVKLNELYECWRDKPFGLKYGPMPVLALAYYLGHRDSTAVYVSGAFQPDFTRATIDEWLVDASRISFRYIKNHNENSELLNKLSEKLSHLTPIPVEPNALSVGRVIVGLVLSAPAWARRSINFEPRTISLKNFALKAFDPVQFVCSDIPSIYETQDSEAIAIGVENSLKEFLEAMPKMLNMVKEHLYRALQIEEKDLVALNARAKAVKGLSGNMVQEAFVSRLSVFTGAESDITGLISLATNRPVQMWSDRDIQAALSKIDELAYSFRKQETFAALHGREENCRVFGVTVASGDQDVVHTVSLSREESAVAVSQAKLLAKSLVSLDPKVALGTLAELGILINKLFTEGKHD